MSTQAPKPGNVQNAGIMMICGGILALMTTLAVGLIAIPYSLCLWTPVTIFGIVAGVLNIVKGSQLAGNCAPGIGVPTAGPVLLIINLINCDMIAPVLGIISLIQLGDPSTRQWLEGTMPAPVPASLPPSDGETSTVSDPVPEVELPPEPAPPEGYLEGFDQHTSAVPEGPDAAPAGGGAMDPWNNWQVPAQDVDAAPEAPAAPANIALSVGPGTEEQDPLAVEPWDVNIEIPEDEES